jgi:hypothetical protein
MHPLRPGTEELDVPPHVIRAAVRRRPPLRAGSASGRFLSWIAAVPLLAGLGVLSAEAYPNVRVDVATPFPEETSITINPLDVGNVVAGAQGDGCYFYTSSDSGTTWTEGRLPSQFDLGDPSVCFDAEGNCFFGYIGTFTHSGIFVNKSTDGGRTWRTTATPVVEHNAGAPFEDKAYPTCDITDGPHQGNVYVAWTRFDHLDSPDPTDSTRIFFSRSTDAGESFSPPVRVSDRGGDARDDDNTVEGAVPGVGPDGTVYVAWSGPRGIEFDRSTNGGLTWGADRVISDQPGGWNFGIPGLYRANGFPVTKADVSPGPHRGRVYVLWSDQRNGDTDVFVVFSDDRGQTWLPRVRVNGDPVGNGAHQFFSWFDVDPVTGFVHAVYYDRRQHPGTELTDVYLATSTDGGLHFTEERISETPFDPTPQVFFGDYNGIAAYGGWVRPFWARLENAQLSVWTALVNPSPGEVCGALAAYDLRVVPNPARGRADLSFCRREEGGVPVPLRDLHLRIVDPAGRVVRTLHLGAGGGPRVSAQWDGRDDAGRRLPNGVYLAVSGDGVRGRFVMIR